MSEIIMIIVKIIAVMIMIATAMNKHKIDKQSKLLSDEGARLDKEISELQLEIDNLKSKIAKYD